MTEKLSECAVMDTKFSESDTMEVCETSDTSSSSTTNSSELETLENIRQFEIANIKIKTELPSDEIGNEHVKEEIPGVQPSAEDVNIKSECDYEDVDDKLLTSKTSMNITDIDLKDFVKKEIDEYEISDEDSDDTMIHDGVKAEDVTVVKSIHSEFDEKILSCEHSDEETRSYCTKCRMLIYILDKNIPSNTENKVIEEIPKDILEIRQSPEHLGIYALKIIPEGVKFGPFMGVNSSNHLWKLKRGKFIVNDDKLQYLNWMKHINPAQKVLDQNLFPFQYEGNIYYRSMREIQQGEELLVYFGGEYENCLNNDVEQDFVPDEQTNAEDVFACTFCCLGFSSVIYLSKHKTMCPSKMEGSLLNKDVMQCPHCKIFLEQWEYLEHHMSYCREKNYRLCTLAPTQAQTKRSFKPIRRQPKLDEHGLRDAGHLNGEKSSEVKVADDKENANLECFVCKYVANEKSQLEDHFRREHFRGGRYRCTKCAYISKRKDHLKLHYFKHVVPKQFRCTTCDYSTSYERSLKVHVDKHCKPCAVKEFKCSYCEFITESKDHMRIHRLLHRSRKECSQCKDETVNGNGKRFKCAHCNYATHQERNLTRHSAKHSSAKPLRCLLCDYTTNTKQDLRRHSLKHDTLRQFKCLICDYVAKSRRSLGKHVATHNLKEFKCRVCDYVTNKICNLKIHATTHEKIKRFKCLQCDYASANKYGLKSHALTHNIDELFKCPHCDYVTNQKRYLRQHCARHETPLTTYTCSQCEYTTNNKFNLIKHGYSHEIVKRFKCSECEYTTNIKFALKRHANTHQLWKRFKCSKCDFTTHQKCYLVMHTCANAAARFQCADCKFQTEDVTSFKAHVCKDIDDAEKSGHMDNILIGIV